MSVWRLPLTLAALPLRFFRRHRSERRPTAPPRILVIRRNRMGDMLCTLPLLHMIRLHFAQAHLAVACDPAGEAVARACPAVNEVIVLEAGSLFKNARRLQDFDWVIAAKGGYDRRLALLTRLTNAAVRIGFARGPSDCFTDPVSLPAKTDEHQIETVLRLGAGLSIRQPTFSPQSLLIQVPEEARAFAAQLLSAPDFSTRARFVLLNLSSTVPLRVRPDDLVELIGRLLATTRAAVGLVFAPRDHDRAQELAHTFRSGRVMALATPGPMELAALLERCAFFITPEGGAAHLAAAVNAPTVVLWSEGPFEKWKSRGLRQKFVVTATPQVPFLTLDQIWTAAEPYLLPLRPR